MVISFNPNVERSSATVFSLNPKIASDKPVIDAPNPNTETDNVVNAPSAFPAEESIFLSPAAPLSAPASTSAPAFFPAEPVALSSF